MSNERIRHTRNTTTTGLMLGALAATVLLFMSAAALIGGPGSALKPAVAVWLAALPVIGFGALCGWLLAFALVAAERGRKARGREQ